MDPPDPKDFLEQLRTVHFTLLGVCLAVVVIVTSPSPTWFDRASEQLKKITTIAEKDNWKVLDWENASAEEISRKFPDQCEDPPKDKPNVLYLRWGTWRFKVVVIHRWDVHYNIPEMKIYNGNILPSPPAPDRPEGYIPPALSPSPPETLREFKAIWDSSGEMWCPADGIAVKRDDQVFLWDPTWHTFSPPGSKLPVPRTEEFKPSPTETLQEKEFVWVMTENLDRGAKDVGMLNRPPVALIQVNDTTKYPWRWSILKSTGLNEFVIGKVTIRSQISKRLTNLSLQDAAFENAFPELDQFAGEQRAFDRSFDYLRKSLEAREPSAKEETFEVFGIKFPMEATTRWAVLLIISMQGYLWLHLNEYRRRRFKKADVAWIGVYTGWAAIFVTALTMFLVPVSVIVLLCIRQELVPRERPADIALRSLACIFSACLAGFTANTLWLINRGSEKPVDMPPVDREH